MEKIKKGNIILGLIIRSIPEGSNPLTEEKEPLQLVTLRHPLGTNLKAHKHAPQKRITETLQECLIVKKGKISIKIYDQEDKLFQNTVLSTGDAYIVMNGGIEINFLEESEILEIKNGPFVEDKIII